MTAVTTVSGGVKFRAVIMDYSAGMISEHRHRVEQFMKDLIMTWDYYGRYEGLSSDKGGGLSYY